MNQRAFSLFEVVATLVLVGILGALVGMMLTSTVRRHLTETELISRNQQSEAALERIVKELRWADMDTIEVLDDGRALRWTSVHLSPASVETQTLAWSGNPGAPLTLDGRVLNDRIETFEVPDTVNLGFVEVRIRSSVAPTTIRTRVYPRSTQ